MFNLISVITNYIKMMLTGSSSSNIMSMKTERTRARGHMKKTWWDCIKEDMKRFGLSCKDAQDSDDWRIRISVCSLTLSTYTYYGNDW